MALVSSLVAGEAISALMQRLGSAAKQSFHRLSSSPSALRNQALLRSAQLLREHAAELLQANERDMQEAEKKQLSPALLDRLKLDEKRVESMASGLEAIAELPDPLHRVLEIRHRPNGLVIEKVSVPLGVIGIIYESRPNVTADAAGLCLKSGNAVILRGGSESLHSSQAIVACLHQALEETGLPKDAVQLVPTRDREAVRQLLSLNEYIDVIIPRGGKSLTARVMQESRVPTLLHLDGNCHTYLHRDADPAMALSVVQNAKLRRTGICGATESLLVDREAARLLLPPIVATLIEKGCEIRGDEASRKLDSRIVPATEQDWETEYLDKIISLKLVENVQEAIAHINRYGSHHTDAIITENAQAAATFLNGVDSAIVMHNASTQFADGGEFGQGAEIGIATGRLHARGPVGAAELTTYKFIVRGTGQIRPA
jgi:glutamate-5-semialdehyde dehydrogenase